MLFNSYDFLFFFPIVWGIWALLRRLGRFRICLGILVAASFVFYGFYDWKLCLLLGSSIGVNYVLHRLLISDKRTGWQRYALLFSGLLFNVGLLFYFKYLDFTIENVNRVIRADIPLRGNVLPLGISFYTFQQLSFVIDSYYRRMKAYSFLEYAAFVSFFPQLVAGPIVLHQELIPQLKEQKKSIASEDIVRGVEYFVIGLAKKMLVADRFAKLVNVGFANVYGLTGPDAVLMILGYTLQIYFDFSGYCDMAIGLGYFFGVKLPVNFDSPYKAKNISEFWKRWHMTLTRFFTTYLYIPLGGNRKGLTRTCMNTLIVFAVSGLWHGAAWTYVLWGVLHGIAMVIWRLFGKWLSKLPGGLNWIMTFGFVNCAWCFFRATYLEQPLHLFMQIFKRPFEGISFPLCGVLFEDSILWETLRNLVPLGVLEICGPILIVSWFLLWVIVCVKAPSSHELVMRKQRSVKWSIWIGFLFALCILKLTQVSEFIYFNF